MSRMREPYECPTLGEIVEVSYEHIIHKSSRTGLIDKEVFDGFDCKSANLCGVMSGDGKYDWGKCAHPYS